MKMTNVVRISLVFIFFVASLLSIAPKAYALAPYSTTQSINSTTSSVVVGQPFTLSIQLKNNGSQIWRTADFINLHVTVSGAVNDSFYVQLPGEIYQNTYAAFNIPYVAPSTSGSITVKFAMEQDGAQFGIAPTSTISVVAKMNQTISFNALGGLNVGGAQGLSATVPSGLPVSFSSGTPGVCSVSGASVTGNGAGTCTVLANQGGDGNYNAAPQTSQSFTVSRIAQNISFTALGALNVGGSQGMSASSSSGMGIAFSSATPATCSVSGSTVYAANAGICTVYADQGGSGTYYPAAQVSQSFAVSKVNQNISFNGLADLTIGASQSMSASAGSALAVSFSSLTPSICSVAGSAVNAASAGVCTVAADQGGNGTYNSAQQATQSFTVSKVNQTINFAALPNLNVGATQGLAANAGSGLPITFASATPSVCGVSGASVSAYAMGTCTVVADQGGNATYNAAAQVAQSFSTVKVNQAITFNALGALNVGASQALAASANSGLAVTFSSASPATCTVAGATVNATGAGTCTVAADQGGNGTYNAAATTSQAFSVARNNQTISFNGLAALTIGGAQGLSAVASSGLAVTFASATPGTCSISANSIIAIAAGTCTVLADQSGNGTYAPAAQATQSFTVNKSSQTISFTLPGSLPVGASQGLAASANSGLGVSFSSVTPGTCSVSASTVNAINVGTCSIAADQGGNGTYNPAGQVVQSFAVIKANQTITFNALAGLGVGAAQTLTAAASSSLAVVYSSGTPATCTVSANSVTALAIGTCTVVADQGGNGTFNPAASANQSFLVSSNTQSITFGTIAPVVYGAAPFAISASASSGLPVTFSSNSTAVCTIAGAAVTVVSAGTCSISATQVGNASWGAAPVVTQGFTVAKQNQTINFGALPTAQLGNAPELSATASSGQAVVFSTSTAAVCTVTSNMVSLVSAGACTINANQAGDGNFNSAAQVSQTFSVIPVPQSSSAAPLAVSIAAPYTTNPLAGSLPGQLSVSNAGAATYSVPISVPPGTAGMVPHVSLDYNSDNTTGSAGLGWSMGGVSNIDRCGRTIATNGIADSVRMVAQDRLCLDGQRLVLVSGDDNDHNAYWAANAEYRTEIESFSRITAQGPSDNRSYLVESRDGRKSYFGATTDSKVLNNNFDYNYVDPAYANTGSIHRWRINQAIDLRGNTIDYLYQLSANGENKPLEIRWGQNASVGQSHYAKVHFNYEDRLLDDGSKEVRNSYIAGGEAFEALRLKSIVTSTDTDAAGSGGTLVHTYTLSYQTSAASRRSLLWKLQACDGAQKCLPETVFTSGKPKAGAVQGFVPLGGTNGERVGPNLGALASENPHSTTGPARPAFDSIVIADFSGDGKADILERYRTASNGYQQTLYTTSFDGSSFAASKPFSGVSGGLEIMEVGDFDGDGLMDVLVSDGGQTLLNWRICKGSGGATPTFACGDPLILPDAAQAGNSVVKPRIVRDFNADGRSDIFFNGGDPNGTYGIPAGPRWMCLSSGTSFNCQQANNTLFDLAYRTPTDFYSSGYDSADIDGDGRAEEIQLGRCKRTPRPTGGGFYWLCGDFGSPSNGGVRISSNADPLGFRQYGWWQPFTKPNQVVVPAAETGTLTVDLNADGYTDMVIGNALGSTNTSLYGGWGSMCFSKGNGTSKCFDLPASDVPALDHLVMTVGDFDGDGLFDVLRPATDTYPDGSVSSYRMCKVRPTLVSGALSVSHTCRPWSGPAFKGESLAVRLDDTGESGGLGVNAPRSGFLGDFDSDGRPDLVTYMGSNYAGGADKWQVWVAADQAEPGQPLDKLVAVQDGYGRTDMVYYAAAGVTQAYTQSALDINGAAIIPAYPVKSAPNTRRLVMTLIRETGEGRSSSTTYNYAGYAVHAQGRGNLGFASVRILDDYTLIYTTKWLRQNYPFVGMVAATVTRTAGGTRSFNACDFSRTVNVYAQQAALRGAYAQTTFPYLAQTTTTRREFGSCEDMGTVVSTTIYGDALGNETATASTSTLGGIALNTTTSTSYFNTVSPWVLGLPDLTTVTKTTPTGGDQSRAIKRTYLNSLLDTETVQPNDLATKVSKKYERNSLGLVTAVQMNWTDPATSQAKSRYSTRNGYDTLNRFAVAQTNAINQVESRDFDHGTGSPKSIIAIDGLTTTLRFDAFGRKEYEAGVDGNEVFTYERQCDGTCPAGAVSVLVKDTRHGGVAIAVPVVAYRDSAGHVLRTDTWGFDGRRIVNETRFDSRGREMDTYWPRFDGETAYVAKHIEYDNLNRVKRIVTRDDANQDVIASNDYHGMSTTMTNGKSQSKTDVRDVWNRLVTSTDAKGGLTRYEHDGFDNLTKTTDDKLNVVTIAYNSVGVRTDLRDPDLGWIHYDVDPLGRTYRQVSPKQRAAALATTMVYDELDRMTDRLEPDLIGHWRFDLAEGQSNCVSNRSCGKLVEADTVDASGNKSYVRTQTYDSLGRPDLVTTLVDTTTYTSRNIYDAWSRPIRVEHQRGSGPLKGFDQRYNDKGYISRIERAGVVLWNATAQDASNRVTQAHLGNGLDVVRGYRPYTGRLENGSVGNAQGAQLQEGYQYDVLGNVVQRSQYWPGSDGFIESFGYDELNRLTSSSIGANGKTYRYDSIGNMMNKPDVSANDYVYPPSGASSIRPHAVSSIPGFTSFTYDDNGNLTDGAGRHADWTSFDMPQAISKGSERSQFVYGPEHQRVRQIRTGTLPATVQYAGAMEVEIAAAGTTVKTYWPAGVGVEIDRPNASTTELSWTHFDRLGSVVAITDETGVIRPGSRTAFDVWGARRELNINTPNPAIDGVVDNKGYTGHEMLDQLDLVHMNGRVYDPLIARFMAADPIIQDPEHSQSYNRYSYVWNNPTNLTDPTGFAAAPLAPCEQQTSCGGISSTGARVQCTRNGAPIDCHEIGARRGSDSKTNNSTDNSGAPKPAASANSAGAGQFGSITSSSGGLANLGEGIGERFGNLVTGRGFISNAEKAEWGEGMSDAVAKGDAAVNAYLRNGLPSDNTAALVGTAAAGAVVSAVRGALNKGTGALLGELSANGVKFNEAAIVGIQRLADGRIVFLEVGNAKAGLVHIMRAHGDDFARAGVSPENIPRLVMDSLSKGRVVGYQGKDMGRPIYELANGQRTAITVGNNGFIVGANPAGR